MTHRFRIITCLVSVLALIFSSYVPAFAMSRRPDDVRYHDETGKFIRDPFTQGDTIRYGGLFGPLPSPEWDTPNNLMNPWARSHDYGYSAGFYYIPGTNQRGQGISPRDMGFAIDENHFIPIAQQRSS